jgi:hypothetical protein
LDAGVDQILDLVDVRLGGLVEGYCVAADIFPSSFPLNSHRGGDPPSPPPPSLLTLKLFGKERRVEGSRALDVGQAGSAGGKSFGFPASSLRRSESSISSSELCTIVANDNISKFTRISASKSSISTSVERIQTLRCPRNQP